MTCSVWLGRALAALATAAFAVPEAAEARKTVPFTAEGFRPGTIVIRDRERALYFLAGENRAYRYRVAVGRRGKHWYGAAYVKGKYVNPAWSPPAEVRRDKPGLPAVIPGGSPRNPMGPRAIMLDRDEIAIHGTNRPKSIGSFASYGCIRMMNADILDLYERVSVGTEVVVTP
jgi:lipoprotein-anchoring transpeptidase ErfK/SrfK